MEHHRVSPLGWAGVTARGVSRGASLSSAPPGIALTRARSRVGPGTREQEMLFFPPAVLQVHGVLQFTLVGFGAVSVVSWTRLCSIQSRGRADGHTQLLPSALQEAKLAGHLLQAQRPLVSQVSPCEMCSPELCFSAHLGAGTAGGTHEESQL